MERRNLLSEAEVTVSRWLERSADVSVAFSMAQSDACRPERRPSLLQAVDSVDEICRRGGATCG